MPFIPEIAHALSKLNNAGYHYTFIKKDNYIHCLEKHLVFCTHELFIDEFYRFGNKLFPSEKSVLYMVEDRVTGLKGTLIN